MKGHLDSLSRVNRISKLMIVREVIFGTEGYVSRAKCLDMITLKGRVHFVGVSIVNVMIFDQWYLSSYDYLLIVSSFDIRFKR